MRIQRWTRDVSQDIDRDQEMHLQEKLRDLTLNGKVAVPLLIHIYIVLFYLKKK